MSHLLRPIILAALAGVLLPSAPAKEKKPSTPVGQAITNPTGQAKRAKVTTMEKGTTNTAAQSNHNSDIIRVTIEPSRPTVTTADTSFAVYADLENVSSSTVVLYSEETSLVVPPEISQIPDCVISYDAFFPTERPSEHDDSRGMRISIPPKEHYSVSWAVTKNTKCDFAKEKSPDANSLGGESCCARMWTAVCHAGSWVWNKLGAVWDLLNFVPGKYVFKVEGKAYNYDAATCQETQYHTFVESASLNVGVSQMVAILAAAFGGFLGYLVIALRPGSQEFTLVKAASGFRMGKALLGLARRIASAMLLSALVTIVSSRVSETSLPIKVSVTDVWGAIALGFIAFFLGDWFIKKLRGLGGGQDTDQKQQQQNPPSGQPGNKPGTVAPPEPSGGKQEEESAEVQKDRAKKGEGDSSGESPKPENDIP